jgi:hypothetical protein
MLGCRAAGEPPCCQADESSEAGRVSLRQLDLATEVSRRSSEAMTVHGRPRLTALVTPMADRTKRGISVRLRSFEGLAAARP